MPHARVIDLSHHNTVDPDFGPAKAEGVVAVIHKLTEGASYVDDKVQARRSMARDQGLAWGVYHFLRPGNMEEQARFFLDTGHELGVIDDETLLAADHEDEDVSAEELKTFLDALEEMSGRSPVVYSGHVIKEQLEGWAGHAKRRLWLAQYCAEDDLVLPDGVDRYWLWQYTDEGQMPGIGPQCDLNHFEGDADEFLRNWAGLHEPAPEPEAMTIRIIVEAPPGVEVKVEVANQTGAA